MVWEDDDVGWCGRMMMWDGDGRMMVMVMGG